MGLTSGGFFALVIVGVVLFPALTLLLWNRLPGPKPVKFGSRLGLILLSQGMAVLLAALWINNSFQLYYSWSDLMGDNGATGAITAATPQVIKTTVSAKGGQSDALPNFRLFTEAHGMAYGTEYQVTVTGPESRITGSVDVWLPAQYTQPAYKNTKFPVIELFPGTPGTPQTWLTAMQAPWVVSRQVDSGAQHPFVLVAAAINVDGHHDPDCSNISHGPQVATWLTQDVRNLVETSFRVSSSRDAWGLMGYSEGGLCASKLALQYPNEYAAAVSISGDDHPDGDLLAPGTTAYEANSPLWLLKHRKPENVALLLTGTEQDSDVASEAAAMSRAAKSPTVVDTLISPRGGHNIGVWKSVEPQSFIWLSEHLTASNSTTYSALPEMFNGVMG
ncbi:MAG TPA: alpha/beta hydrolase-fold protein [Actinospica sp.]|jgi:enterochelin esterase-like enzyme|nr:alpha/beta hydrolase-fold protein [Actinospica sp.]